MKIKLLAGVAFLSMSLFSAAATADDDKGVYVRANAGYGTHTDAQFNDTLIVGDVQSEGGLAGTLGLGYDFGNNWRIELDGDSMFTQLGAVQEASESFAKVQTNSVMLNAIYDFSGFEKWEPYVGIGAGLVQADVSAQVHSILGSPACPFIATFGRSGPGDCTINDKDTALGYQLIAGVGRDITENLTWDTHYTYMDVDPSGFDLDSVYTPATNLGTVTTHLGELNGLGGHSIVTGFRYKFGAPVKRVEKAVPLPPAPAPTYTCWDSSVVNNLENCPVKPAPVVTTSCWDGTTVTGNQSCPAQPQTYTCWDNSIVYDTAQCPVQQPVQQTISCWDGSLVYDAAQCPIQRASYNNCGANNVAIFNVPVNSTPKQMSRLGTMPEFGDSHGLSPYEFFEKLQGRYNDNATDKAYLNYLFKSMGYAGGFSDANASMFSEETLPVGTSGMLGLGKQHHYKYSVLPSTDRDRQAFRIQSANGSVVHFMKTCGNYMYACN